MKGALKSALFGDEPRSFAVRAGLLKGMNFYLDPRVDTQQITGFYEREIADSVRRLAARARTVLDIGANDGFYTLFFAGRPGVARVVACEPDTSHLDRLERNLALNPSGFRSKVSIRPVAVGTSANGNFEPLDRLLEGCPEPVLLKIDVEGAEMDVLNSGKKSLTTKDLMLILETHSAQLETQCLDLLRRMGYRCEVRKNGWYRALMPELRYLPHNRWLIAER